MGGALGSRDGVVLLGRVFVGKGHRRPGFARVPDEVAGERADQHVGTGSLVAPMTNGRPHRPAGSAWPH